MIEIDTSPFEGTTGKKPHGSRLYVFRVGNKAFSTDGLYSERLAEARTWFRELLRKRDFVITVHAF